MKQTVVSLTLALVSFTSSLRAGFFSSIKDAAGRGMDYAKNAAGNYMPGSSSSGLTGEADELSAAANPEKCKDKKQCKSDKASCAEKPATSE